MGVKPAAGLLEAMQRQAMATAGDFKPQNVANVVWALATMGVKPAAGLLEAMQRQAMATAGDFNPHNVANLAWALATMGVKPAAGLLEAMQGRARATAGDFKPQEVANLLWALATMGVTPAAGLLEAMQKQAMATAGDFNPQAVTNLVWAHACFGAPYNQLSGPMAESMAVQLLSIRDQLSIEGKRQIHQWLLFCNLDPEWRRQLPRNTQKVKEELGGGCRQAFGSGAVSTSRTQVSGQDCSSAP
jgi:hypothetical protein